MASTFINAGAALPVGDSASANVYTCPAGTKAVIHACMISNLNSSGTSKGTIKITTDGGSTFRHVIKDGEVPPNDTLQMDKPLNLEAGDIIRIYGDVANMECFLSILELS